MSLTPMDIAIIFTPLLSLLAMIYTWFKTRVKSAKFLVFNFHIAEVTQAERKGEKIAQITSKFTILNTGDGVGYLRFKRAKLKGRLRESKENANFEIEQPEYIKPEIFTLKGGIDSDRSFTFETNYTFIIVGWEKGEITAEGTYLTHKGRTKKFSFKFVGPSEKESLWESPRKKKEKTIVRI